jgi:hypothetical protein
MTNQFVDSASVDEILRVTENKLNDEINLLMRELLEEQTLFDHELFSKIASLNSTNKSWNLGEKYFEALREKTGQGKDRKEGFIVQDKKRYVLTTEDANKFIRPIIEAYVYNNYVNGYFLNQVVTGPFALYKNGKVIVKRLAGATGAGHMQLISHYDERTKKFSIGSKEKFSVLIVKDVVGAKNEKDDDVEAYKKNSSIQRFLRNMFIGNKQLSESELIDVNNEIDAILKYYSDKGYDITDAQAFMTVAREADIRAGLNDKMNFSGIAKNMYFGIETIDVQRPEVYDTEQKAKDALKKIVDLTSENNKDAPHSKIDTIVSTDENGIEKTTYQITTAEPITFYLKNSHIVLTDDLVNKFPRLKAIKNFLEYQDDVHQPIGELVFETGIKVGKPKNNPTFAELTETTDNESIGAKRTELMNRGTKILSLSNVNNRIQFNPQSDLVLTKNKIALFSQIMYFINTGQNKSWRADEAYQAQGYLLEKGLLEFEKNVGSSPVEFDSFIKKELAKSPEAAHLYELMVNGLSANSLLMDKKIITLLTSNLSKTQFGKLLKFKGGKFTLMTAEGSDVTESSIRFDGRTTELEYRIQKTFTYARDADGKIIFNDEGEATLKETQGMVSDAYLPKAFFYNFNKKHNK